MVQAPYTHIFLSNYSINFKENQIIQIGKKVSKKKKIKA